ncbi:lysozyme [Caulobacter ginsengisoli]|uniref:Lysozyme n=1 Tax=Caulobacter ginsengisoli TaxID=400775 RepID=A0ABU0ILA5_9CAUL|nr:glycoside hydrolase family protein [Caulobacter ginsengisoli]MDQ0462806.1 lysozyme [Caulobacter ginsengisoli]
MKPRHQVSRAAIELIKRFEGYRRKAAQLADGRWTIGYGHTLTAREGAEVSESDAEALLLYDMIAVSHAVNEWTYTPLTQNQFDALCAFAFNIGVENFRRSSALRRVNEGALLQAACAMEMWRKADFEGERIVIDALVRRRSAEKTLFLTPAGGWIPAPSPVLKPKVDYDAVNAVPRQAPTAVTTDLTGDKAVAKRDEPVAAPAAPVSPSLSEAAASRVESQLQTLVPEAPQAEAPRIFVVPGTPLDPEPLAGAPVETAPAAQDVAALVGELVQPEELAPFPGLPELMPEEPAAPSPPPASSLDFPPIPTGDTAPSAPQSQPEPPRAAPTLTVVGTERAFALSPPPEDLEIVEPEAALDPEPAPLPVAANESEPGLFETPFPSFSGPSFNQSFDAEYEAAPSRPLVNEDYVRRLVQEDERASMALELDAEFHDVEVQPGRINGLPWLGGVLVGILGFGGGVVWAVKTHDPVIGYSVAVLGILIGGVSSWQWLRSLGVLNATGDEEGEPQDQV